ncbi:demethylmenaquinone methyltransferase/2-methoxy-6-polyprenyl-1,4-benzoquinol methylase [Paucibacter oligotrophus]|uniref:Demethylmenaquinone methyltransferase/2-methoxy-6-polyprenyl-1,4-benzoquinol methylase n=1 Tax=Roseateles oligotrophus TaxID=1769250 RepID=A0A840L902_9BURK|nr:class I SAM-dependent methyltransferase [Roseateles oligotrophus]MBB4843235.1 demethylmenaquinone methyltransferase/2-methoxy-6-polyprenyl-1,4-benzoquinol methylase [Roseateles oligotrophus]
MPISDAELSRHQHMPRYYAQRAKEYERVFDKPHRQPDLARLKQWLAEQFSGRHVLEIATGTGYWLPAATSAALSWLGTDINPEVLAEARAKPLDQTRVSFRLANAYAPGIVAAGAASPFDAGFAGLWFSHVPIGRQREWLQGLHSQLQPGARVLLIENRYVEGDSTPVHRYDAEGNGYQLRHLSDGSEHEVMKNFPSEARMQALLAGLGQDLVWRELDYFWTLSYRKI